MSTDSKADEIATDVIRGVAELPDRNSPEDQPDMMLVNAVELRDLITTAIAAHEAQRVTTITPLEEQQMFDDWCPYKGNPDPRTVWAAAIDAVNGMRLMSTQAEKAPSVQAVDASTRLRGLRYSLAEGWDLIPRIPLDFQVERHSHLGNCMNDRDGLPPVWLADTEGELELYNSYLRTPHQLECECLTTLESLYKLAGIAAPQQPSVPTTDRTFMALQSLTEGILTRGEPDFMRRRLEECIAIMAEHGWQAPIPFTENVSFTALFAAAPKAV